MNKIIVILATAGLWLSCIGPFSSNDCELSEQYTVNTTHFVKDKGYQKYEFKFAFEQSVEIWIGDCAAEKNKNSTNLKLTSNAPCRQTVNFTIDVNMGAYSYQIKRSDLVIQPKQTIDLGVVAQGGGRIDGAQVEIALYCPLCPEDQP